MINEHRPRTGQNSCPPGPALPSIAKTGQPEILTKPVAFSAVCQGQIGAPLFGQFEPYFHFIVNGFFSGCCQLRQERKSVSRAFVFNRLSASLGLSLRT
jgi:hypothetical protein